MKITETWATEVFNLDLVLYQRASNLFRPPAFVPQCQESKDLELGYKVQSFAEVGENWRLMGDAFQQSIY